MSSLKWDRGRYAPYSDPTVIEDVWELWDTEMDRTAWYNLPCASIRKKRDHQWELTMPDDPEFEVRYFRTLKEAKAMGITLYRMSNDA